MYSTKKPRNSYWRTVGYAACAAGALGAAVLNLPSHQRMAGELTNNNSGNPSKPSCPLANAGGWPAAEAYVAGFLSRFAATEKLSEDLQPATREQLKQCRAVKQAARADNG